MTLSIEALVAAFLALIFAVLSFGAIAREQGDRPPAQTHGPALGYVTVAGPAQTDVLGFY